jgi:Flp pilus assembly protein TadG
MLGLMARLTRRTEGNVTVLFALAVVPLLIAAGSAIDYIRFLDTKTSVQAALDGAALAAATPVGITDAQRIAVAKDYFRSNVSFKAENGAPIDIDVKVSIDTVAASVNANVATSFMRLGGVNTMKLDEMAEVMRPFDGKAEVVLVLDYSGSMDKKNKYQDMSAAAREMIDELDKAMKDNALKIGLVPFSAMVYTSMDKSFVTQASATQTWTGCTQDRKFPYNTTVDTPTANPDSKWGFDKGLTSGGKPMFENAGIYSCAYYEDKNLKIVPLTADLSDVKSKISKMRPIGNTNIPLGAEFGWNLLDPQEPYTEGAPYSNTKTRKFLVLLTDGVQTSSQWDKNNSRSISQAEANLLDICKGMRDANVTVFTIAYDITNPKVTELLKDCAPGHYYEPDSGGSEIKLVFSQITSQIKNRIARVSR